MLTQEQIAFRAKQEHLLHIIWGGDESAKLYYGEQYDLNIASLTQDQLNTWPVLVTDPGKAEVLHNVYKSEHGVRPPGSMTLPEAEEFLKPFLVKGPQ